MKRCVFLFTFLASCQQADPQASNNVEAGVATYRTPDDAPTSPQTEKRKFWVYDKITQGISRADLMKLAELRKYKVTYPFGGDSPTVAIDGTEYTFGFCNDQLTFASWLIDTNEQLIKSISQRTRNEGFRIAGGDAESRYNDATRTDLNSLTLRLRHPDDATAYSVEYAVFDKNSQITLEDTRFDDTFNCDPEG